MSIKHCVCHGHELISLEGAFDAQAVQDGRAELEQVAHEATQGVVVDMSRVDFLDSSGIGALVFMYKRLTTAHRELHLVGLTNQPARLIRLLRIDRVIKTYANMTEFMAQAELELA